MPKLCKYVPTVENTELFALFQRTNPQIYSSIASNDKFLLRYASNTWNILIPNCVFHPELNSIRIPIEFHSEEYSDPIVLDVPYSQITSLGFTKHSNPYCNTITLECLCEVYILADSCVFRLPTTIGLKSLYPMLSDEGLTFTLSLSEIVENKVIDNLTKISLFFRGEISTKTNEIVIYPLQRLPPQPLSGGVFQMFSNLTPFQSLQLVHAEVIEGTELSQKMMSYFNSINSVMTPLLSNKIDSDIPDMSEEVTLSATGHGDDEVYSNDFDKFSDQITMLESMGAMSVEMIGGFNSTGTKRGRTASNDTIQLAEYHAKQKRI